MFECLWSLKLCNMLDVGCLGVYQQYIMSFQDDGKC